MERERIGKYEIVGLIGAGAMGRVYRARDPLLKRDVALKTISASLAADPGFRRRFRREAQAAARLNHPNVVTIFDYGEDEDGLTYMAMELLEGTDLRTALRAGTVVALERKLDVIGQLADGLAFAHSRGVVHRDVKPGNVHLLPNGEAKILDFGLARLETSDITAQGAILGTPYYMSPEQVRGEAVDCRSDVFSLGAVCHEVLTGVRPFDGGSLHEVLGAILREDPAPVRRLAPETPQGVASVVERCLRKDPVERYAHAGDVAAAIASERGALGRTLTGATATQLAPAATVLQEPGATVIPAPSPAPADTAPAEAPAGSAAHGSSAGASSARSVSKSAGAPSASHRAATGPARGRLRRRPVLLLGAALAIALLAAGLALWRGRSGPAARAPQLDVLSEAMVTSQIELARSDLDGRDYAAATEHARAALALDPANAAARELLGRAQSARRELDVAVDRARAAYGRGDIEAAAAALERVLALDPRSPVAGELSDRLDRHFRSQAEQARRSAREERAAAQSAGAGSGEGFAAAGALLGQGEGLFRRERYAAAAQKFLESRTRFEVVRRAAEIARAARKSPAAGGADRTAAAPVITTPPAPRETPGLGRLPAPPPPAAPEPVPAQPASPARGTVEPGGDASGAASTTAATALPSPPSAHDDEEARVRDVIARYARAIETRDVAAFRQLMPELTGDGEKKLRAAFGAVQSQQVGITVEGVEVDGGHATVRVVRRDTVNGRPQKPVRQEFRLVQKDGGWRIASMSAR